VSELVDRACKLLGDLPFARGFQGTANVSVGSNDSCLVRVTRGLDCLVGGGPGRVDRCLVSRARDTETRDRNCYGASHAYESRGGTNERCLDDRIHAVMLRGQRHRIERGRRAGGSDRASLTLRPESGRSDRQIEVAKIVKVSVRYSCCGGRSRPDDVEVAASNLAALRADEDRVPVLGFGTAFQVLAQVRHDLGGKRGCALSRPELRAASLFRLNVPVSNMKKRLDGWAKNRDPTSPEEA